VRAAGSPCVTAARGGRPGQLLPPAGRLAASGRGALYPLPAVNLPRFLGCGAKITPFFAGYVGLRELAID